MAVTAPVTRTVSEHIDETGQAGLTALQQRTWFLAAAGKFFEGMIVFLVGVATPLIAAQYSLSTAQIGLVTAMPLLGILIGASALGGLADKVGRRPLFLWEMGLLTACLVGVSFSNSLPIFLLFLLGTGLALGSDYPVAHLMISETLPTKIRGRRVLAAFGFQAVGAVAGTGVGMLVLSQREELSDWRIMFALVIIPAFVVTIARIFTAQSPHWLASKGRYDEAEAVLAALCFGDHKAGDLRITREAPVVDAVKADQKASQSSIKTLFKRPLRRATILTSVPWFLQDLGTYGIGIFTPIVIATTLGTDTTGLDDTVSGVIASDLQGAEGAFIIDTFLLVGLAVALFLVDRVGRIRLQVVGFIGCGVGLAIAASSVFFENPTFAIFAGFMIFNFSTNLGPNTMTYVLAGEVFPTRVRGKGAGFAASAGKVGAVLTAFLFPTLLDVWGQGVLLTVLVATSLLGAVITWKFRINTVGMSLEQVDTGAVIEVLPAAPAPRAG
ncbi:MFS transporter [Microbacterium sp. R86528]|uniref:MFS transporter n=1 Tax=Microbacterium sp. R86528 TaxID=3093864 RepID=UPI0037CAF2CE